MTNATKITLYACNCGSYFRTEAEANAHCVCEKKKCSNLVKRGTFTSEQLCPACRHKSAIRYAQSRVRSLKKDLASAEKHLAKLKGKKS